MVTALEICVGLMLTATLLTAAAVLAAFQLGRLVTRDHEQREVTPSSARRIRYARDLRALGRR